MGVSVYKFSDVLVFLIYGLDVGKYENNPHKSKCILNPVSGKVIAWLSDVVFTLWILGVSLSPASPNTKG
eukprot:15211883-Ditylum_brightwellii.AAC.2